MTKTFKKNARKTARKALLAACALCAAVAGLACRGGIELADARVRTPAAFAAARPGKGKGRRWRAR